MVEYKKKKLILQSGGTRNYYYKVSSDGKKKQVSKNEYLEKKGGTINQNNELLLKLKEVFNKPNINKNYKAMLYYQIIDLELKKLQDSDLNALLDYIYSILDDNIDRAELERHEEILKKLAHEFSLSWTVYTGKITAEINRLKEGETESLLDRLVKFVEIFKTKKRIIDVRNDKFIIIKLIREIMLRIYRNEITVQDKYYNRILAMDSFKSKNNNNNNQSLTYQQIVKRIVEKF